MLQYFTSTHTLHHLLEMLSKYSDVVSVGPCTLETSTIRIELPEFCSFRAQIKISELIELLRRTTNFELYDSYIVYAHRIETINTNIVVNNKLSIQKPQKESDLGTPIVSFKFKKFPLITKGLAELILDGDKFITTTNEIVATAQSQYIDRIEGIANLRAYVDLVSLKPIQDFSGDLVLSWFENCILIHSFEQSITITLIAHFALSGT